MCSRQDNGVERIPVGAAEYMTITSKYAPTLKANKNAEETVYEQLHSTLQNIPRNDRVVLVGDLNAKVGSSTEREDGYGSVAGMAQEKLTKTDARWWRSMHIAWGIYHQHLLGMLA